MPMVRSSPKTPALARPSLNNCCTAAETPYARRRSHALEPALLSQQPLHAAPSRPDASGSETGLLWRRGLCTVDLRRVRTGGHRRPADPKCSPRVVLAFRWGRRLALQIRSCPSTLSAQDMIWSLIKRLTNCRMEHSLAELMVLCHQLLEVRTAKLSAGSGRAIPHLGFKRGFAPPATHCQLHALDPGSLFS
jgi:hypothetical protein